jgi:hypothetical protein
MNMAMVATEDEGRLRLPPCKRQRTRPQQQKQQQGYPTEESVDEQPHSSSSINIQRRKYETVYPGMCVGLFGTICLLFLALPEAT